VTKQSPPNARSSPRHAHGAATTAPALSTDRSAEQPFGWALQWVYPSAQSLPLPQGTTTIGREAGVECVLEDEQVSRKHAACVVSGASCRVVDLGSSNGVTVDGKRIRDVSVRDGAIVRVGGTLGVVVYGPAPTVAPRVLATAEGQSYIGSAKLAQALERAEILAPLPHALLVRGASGSGKELVAERLHRASGRSGKYVTLNCARLQPNLAASELFGHVKGAFSGAVGDARGAIRSAAGGTLFLDEVAELDAGVQAQLLRFLERGEVTPLGGRTETVATRVVTATHADLLALAARGAFREDLYYRLAVHVLELPALAARREDIVALFEHFAGRPRAGLSPGFVSELLLAPWPGNVRELRNLATRLRAEHASDAVWSHHLFGAGRRSSEPPARSYAAEALSREDWAELYRAHGSNAAAVARAIGVSQATVKRYVAKFGLKT
jgi:transcriptional regulator with AAA-type ATPase domain